MKELAKLDIKASRVMFVSDIHFGKHVNSEEWQNNMRNYFYDFFIPKIKETKQSLKEDEELIVINLGDTYDDRKAIDINVQNLCIDVFEDIAKEAKVFIINGNHDLAKKTNEGNASIRSLEHIPNVTLVTSPTMLNVNYEAAKHTKILAIPYLGNLELESEYLSAYSGKAKYALMHTEIAKMKMDNGMLITNGVNSDLFNGKIYSGHIHKRQELKKVVYVGAPYQMSKGDIGNEVGIYVLNLKTNKHDFIPNNYSPIYHSITIEKYSEMSDDDRKLFMNNNYNFILIPEDDIPAYKKKYDIYNLGDGTTAKTAKPIVIKHKQSIAVEEDNDYKEKTIEDLINESINQLEVDDEAKDRLQKISGEYLKDAESKLQND